MMKRNKSAIISIKMKKFSCESRGQPPWFIKETINYYPFGSEMTMNSPAQITPNPNWQPYRFSGKELIRQNGLNMYDFGARLYDVAGIPMWTSMDPLCEENYQITPYSYCNGDPVNRVDPDGKKVVLVYYNNSNRQNTLTVDGPGVYKHSKSQFVSDFFKAYNYNVKNGGGQYMKQAVNDPTHSYYVYDATDKRYVEKQITGFYPQDGKAIITWESRVGLKTTEGGKQSAATRLEHEFFHAIDNTKNPTMRRYKSESFDPQYENAEERDAVKAENETSVKNGEAIRTNHFGQLFQTDDPTSTKPIKQQ